MNLNTNTTSHLQIPFYAPFILTGFQHFSPSFLASAWLLGVQSVIAVSLSSWADRSDAPSSQPASFFIFSFSYSFFYPPYQVKCQTFSLFFSPSEPLSESQRTQHSPDLYCSAGTSQRCAFSSFILWHYSFNFFTCEILVLFFLSCQSSLLSITTFSTIGRGGAICRDRLGVNE